MVDMQGDKVLEPTTLGAVPSHCALSGTGILMITVS